MKLSVSGCLLIVAGSLVSGCGGNPSGPSDVNQFSGFEVTPGPPSGLMVLVECPEFGESSRCTAFAGDNNGGQDVTGLATWSTSDRTVALVNSTGVVTILSTGEVAIQATYRGASGFRLVWAVPGRGLHGISRFLAGVVLSTNGAVPGVMMQILNGPNAGRTVMTSAEGRFFLEDLQDGQFTIRLSKPGYVTAEYMWSIPGGSERTTGLTVAPG